jgi:hypothetical protein
MTIAKLLSIGIHLPVRTGTRTVAREFHTIGATGSQLHCIFRTIFCSIYMHGECIKMGCLKNVCVELTSTVDLKSPTPGDLFFFNLFLAIHFYE